MTSPDKSESTLEFKSPAGSLCTLPTKVPISCARPRSNFHHAKGLKVSRLGAWSTVGQEPRFTNRMRALGLLFEPTCTNPKPFGHCLRQYIGAHYKRPNLVKPCSQRKLVAELRQHVRTSTSNVVAAAGLNSSPSPAAAATYAAYAMGFSIQGARHMENSGSQTVGTMQGAVNSANTHQCRRAEAHPRAWRHPTESHATGSPHGG